MASSCPLGGSAPPPRPTPHPHLSTTQHTLSLTQTLPRPSQGQPRLPAGLRQRLRRCLRRRLLPRPGLPLRRHVPLLRPAQDLRKAGCAVEDACPCYQGQVHGGLLPGLCHHRMRACAVVTLQARCTGQHRQWQHRSGLGGAAGEVAVAVAVGVVRGAKRCAACFALRVAGGHPSTCEGTTDTIGTT